jgi:hypothetical protein
MDVMKKKPESMPSEGRITHLLTVNGIPVQRAFRAV